MKKIISSIIVLGIVLALFPLTVFAGASGSASASEVEVGKDVTVTFSFSYDKEIGGLQGNISYDTSKLKYVSLSGTLGDTNTNSPESGTIPFLSYINSANSAKKTCSVSVVFTTVAVGSTTVKLNETSVAAFDESSLGSPTASVSINIKAKPEEKLSSDCTLKSLQPPTGCTLEPKFSSSVTEYTCTVPYSVEKFPLEPTRNDSKAKIEYIGSVTLKVGDNQRSVKVTAQDGTTKTYTVKIKRLSQTDSPTTAPAVTPDIPQSTNILVSVNGKEMALSTKITSTLPEKFTVEKFDYEGTEIETAVLGIVRLAELADGEECGFYIYDNENKTFEKYVSYSAQGGVYTILSKSESDVSSLTKTNIALDENTTVSAWLLPQFGEGYYLVSVLNNETGESYLAVYCQEDKSIQKFSANILNGASTETNTETNVETAQKFKFSKEVTGYILIGLCSAVIIAGITVIIIVIVKNTKKKKRFHDWNEQFEEYDTEPEFKIYTGHDSDFDE